MPINENIRQRRHEILQILKEEGKPLTLQALQKILTTRNHAVSLPTLRLDIRALIETDRAPLERSHGTVALKANAKTEFERRSGVQRHEKDQIAEVATALLFADEETQQCILAKVGKKIGWQGLSVSQILKGIWQKSNRVATLDASTTSVAVAQKIALSEFPNNSATNIRIVTNSPEIVYIFHKNRDVTTVLIGGEMHPERYSIVGHLAERCIDAFNLVTDVSFVGATSIDLQRGFTSDEVAEAHFKTRLLDLSRIRCVVVDYTKITQPAATFSVFLDFSSQKIDFVIMDDRIAQRELSASEKGLFKRFQQQLDDAGICLLTRVRLGLPRPDKEAAKGKNDDDFIV